jgi:hypothetical protein
MISLTLNSYQVEIFLCVILGIRNKNEVFKSSAIVYDQFDLLVMIVLLSISNTKFWFFTYTRPQTDVFSSLWSAALVIESRNFSMFLPLCLSMLVLMYRSFQQFNALWYYFGNQRPIVLRVLCVICFSRHFFPFILSNKLKCYENDDLSNIPFNKALYVVIQ